MSDYLNTQFRLTGQVAIVTGATGVLGGAIARGLAQAGAAIGILGRRRDRAEQVAAEIIAAGGDAIALPADVLVRSELVQAQAAALARWGRIDMLVNAAGGNVPAATLAPGAAFFDLPEAALRDVFDLNLMGTLLPCQVFGATLAERKQGAILNISSMAATRVITRVVGYSAAKSAVENLTRWLAVELARRHGAGVRVNALAPGFFVGDQNRRLLLNDDGSLTERGQLIIDHTPAGRFGEPDELVATAIWLCGPGARFVTGIVVPVDGGFGAFSGV
jgi:NAD(P)-dependent dehydrogenase (short-subunit alcohol dehydrogenase family)